jgi:hypothetical protein
MTDYCPCEDEKPDPCPACGATVSGKDRWQGRCQARYGSKAPPSLFFVLEDKETREVVASAPVL